MMTIKNIFLIFDFLMPFLHDFPKRIGLYNMLANVRRVRFLDTF